LETHICRFSSLLEIEDEEVRKLILHLTCCLLPQSNRDSMEAICLFLRWVASFSHVDDETGSKMDLHNLATVITPNILYSKSKDPIKDESFLAIEAVMGLLQYQDDFCVVNDPNIVLLLQPIWKRAMIYCTHVCLHDATSTRFLPIWRLS